MLNSSNTTIGGIAAGAGNVIAGYTSTGIDVSGAASTGTVIQGNFIGTDVGGTLDLTAGLYGITLQTSATGVLIGGTTANSGNTIANHSTNGVRLAATAGTGNQVRGNSIYDNTAIGIDAGVAGATANDDESDGIQNHPVLTSALYDDDVVTVAGTLTSTASTTFLIDFYSNDATNGDQGQTFLGFISVTTDVTGNATFQHTFTDLLVATDVITATATEDLGGGSFGSTSEFSAAQSISDGSPTINEIIKLYANDAAASDSFGVSVAIDGHLAIVGATGDDDNGADSGSAYVYEFDGVNWNQVVKLTPTDGVGADNFGSSVAIDGNCAVVGAIGDDDTASSSGSAYVFEYDGTAWTEVAKLNASDATANDWFGSAVAISGNRIAIGPNRMMTTHYRLQAASICSISTVSVPGTRLASFTRAILRQSTISVQAWQWKVTECWLVRTAKTLRGQRGWQRLRI